MRCNHCKSKMKPIKHDFSSRSMCKTCFKYYNYPYDIYYKSRKDIYKEVKGKWLKQKIPEKQPYNCKSKYKYWKIIENFVHTS